MILRDGGRVYQAGVCGCGIWHEKYFDGSIAERADQHCDA
jgi:hypothetical protein